MITYYVKKYPAYVDVAGYGSFQPVSMTRHQAEHAAYETGGIVQMFENGVLVREYKITRRLPSLRIEKADCIICSTS